MCMLTYLPPGIQPDHDALRNGALLNDHGHGFAIVTSTNAGDSGGRVLVHRGMDADAVIIEFERQRRAHPEGPALFHSRFATHGPVGVANTHPFLVGNDPRTVLAHNGILPTTVHPGRGDSRSDTRIAAEDFFSTPDLRSLERPATRRRITRWLGPGNKLLILTADPRYRRHAYLFNEHVGHWDNGAWYSNLDYQPHDPTEDGCLYCGLVEPVDPDSGLCLACGCCPVCGSDAGNCTPICEKVLFYGCPDCGEDIRSCACPLPEHLAL